MSATEKVLIVEDDASILNGLELNLQLEGYHVVTARDGTEGIERYRASAPDLVILDVMMPRKNGFEVLTEIRRLDAQVPVLLLTAKDTQPDKLSGLMGGADDYITKPFALPELLARINAALRRRRLERQPEPIRFGDVEVDLERSQASRGGEPMELTAREFALLAYLVQNKERVLSRTQILERVWGHGYDGTERTVDNFVLRLRQKVERDPAAPEHLVTVRGLGYRFVP